MNNFTNSGGVKPANTRQNLLQQTKLSRLPKLPARASNLVTARKSACITCQSNLGNESEFSRRIKVCAACLAIYTKIDDAISAANENRKSHSETDDFTY